MESGPARRSSPETEPPPLVSVIPATHSIYVIKDAGVFPLTAFVSAGVDTCDKC